MPSTTFETLIFSLLALVATGGLGASWYAHTRCPWGRINRGSRVSLEPETVAVTRLGTVIGFASFVPFSAGAWAHYAGGMAELRRTADAESAQLTLLDQIAIAVPGELLISVGLLAMVASLLVPLLFVVRDGMTALLGWRNA